MTWLIGLLKMILELVVPIAINKLVDYLRDGKEISDWKKAEKAKLDEAAKNYKQALKEAGDNEEAQKAAFDKFLNSSR